MLHVKRKSGKLAVSIDADNARFLCNETVLVSVHSNGPPSGLPCPDAVPEMRVGRADLEIWVLIIGHHRQYRDDCMLDKQPLDFSPHIPIHARADVVESQ